MGKSSMYKPLRNHQNINLQPYWELNKFQDVQIDNNDVNLLFEDSFEERQP